MVLPLPISFSITNDWIAFLRLFKLPFAYGTIRINFSWLCLVLTRKCSRVLWSCSRLYAKTPARNSPGSDQYRRRPPKPVPGWGRPWHSSFPVPSTKCVIQPNSINTDTPFQPQRPLSHTNSDRFVPFVFLRSLSLSFLLCYFRPFFLSSSLSIYCFSLFLFISSSPSFSVTNEVSNSVLWGLVWQ
jgi:hypothetical protein